MQNTYQSTSTNNYLSRQGNIPDPYLTSNRPTSMTTSTSSVGGGYQSIIGRRRQVRHDDPNNYFVDNPTVGDGYSSSLFVNSQNAYPINNHYMDMSDQPPVIPPRFRRTEDLNDQYRRHSTDDYLSENLNNNNNNYSQTLPREPFLHHAYPATITNSNGFRPINNHYHQYTSEQEEVFDRAQSTSSTNSSESFQQQRSSQIRQQQRLPPPSSYKGSPDHSNTGLIEIFLFEI